MNFLDNPAVKDRADDNLENRDNFMKSHEVPEKILESESLLNQDIVEYESDLLFEFHDLGGVQFDNSKTTENQEVVTTHDNSESEIQGAKNDSSVSIDNLELFGSSSPKKSSESKKVKVINPETSKLPLYKCNSCDKKYSVLKTLQRHVREYHLNKYTCDSCNVEFGRKENLNRHIASQICFVTDELENLTFKCKKCKKLFLTQEKLNNHEIHNCTKKYFCSICLHFFKKRIDLLSHVH